MTLLCLSASGGGLAAEPSAIPPETRYVQVVITLQGMGSVTDDTDFECADRCRLVLPAGRPLMLTARDSAGYRLASWDGCPDANGPGCRIVPQRDIEIVARFEITGADCAEKEVRCVGSDQEYRSIQKAVNAARPGHTVLVFPGRYSGFIIRDGGTQAAPLRVRALGEVLIDRPYSGVESSEAAGILLFNVSDVIVEGFHVTGMPGFGIAARGASGFEPMRRLVIRANRVERSRSVNIYLSQVEHSVIDSNRATDSATSHGIYLANGGSDFTRVSRNRCHGNALAGIHFNGDRHQSGDGLISGLLVEENVVSHNRQNGLNMDGVQRSLIRNNLVYRNARHALRAFIEDAAPAEWGEGGGVRDLKIVNNTFLASGPESWALKISGDAGGHTIFNNILLAADRAGGSISLEHARYFSDHNIVIDRFSRDNAATIIDHDAWRKNGQDTHSSIATMETLFEAAAADDYRPRTGSPARNAGVVAYAGVTAPDSALEGTPRPLGAAHEVGAHELID